jgi:hypothetical protein
MAKQKKKPARGKSGLGRVLENLGVSGPAGKAVVPAPAKSATGPAEAKITPAEYGGLQAAFDHFNAKLFEGTLLDVMIVLQRQSHSRGHFGVNRFAWRGDGSGKHELSLNPDHFVGRTDEEICSTLVHEQAHVWQ